MDRSHHILYRNQKLCYAIESGVKTIKPGHRKFQRVLLAYFDIQENV